MASTNIPWGTGNSGGDIVVNYTGNKNGTVSVSSSVVNQSIDRSQEILVQGTTHPEAQAVISVTQIGLREVFNVTDGPFRLSDGGTFNVLKEA